MAWNPSKEVAAARDAAKVLNDAPMCVVVWIAPDGKNVGMASYGKTKPLCQLAGELGKRLLKSALTWGEEETSDAD